MKALDLFCGAGGAAMGLHRAGFEVVGVDNTPQPKYPFEFILGDALNPPVDLSQFDLIWASPPCQQYSVTRSIYNRDYPDLVDDARLLLKQSGKLYIIENVPGAPLENPLMLCGTMFGLRVLRHRLFETNPPIYMAPFTCRHHMPVKKSGRRPNRDIEFINVTGHFSDVEYAKFAMDIDWMGQKELSQAIPPAYSKWLGEQMIKALNEMTLASEWREI
jgi:DNA (cytosine-5)-methyltransferase 1